jgi:hypothetical protein
LSSGILSGILSGMSPRSEERVRENRLRLAAQRQGVRLQRSRRRDIRALDYGVYYLHEMPATRGLHFSSGPKEVPDGPLSLDDVEAWLDS